MLCDHNRKQSAQPVPVMCTKCTCMYMCMDTVMCTCMYLYMDIAICTCMYGHCNVYTNHVQVPVSMDTVLCTCTYMYGQ